MALADNLTKEELEKIRDECNRRLALIAKYDDAYIQTLQSTHNELSGSTPTALRALLDAVEGAVTPKPV